ncbi:MAG: ribosome maturation factor RimP [Dethiobacter sp.]|jgi:ribosome maturation factor RimP|nr:ribosome maturation factor RimP [Dethiobacter sp.]MBS3900655.1 ribosome maturation factor RimP [Dethiobacter sp.]MBS3989623.1 ribosome maturation factor RimP [Dethiobacter sp.]
MSKINKIVMETAAPLADALGLELVDVEFVKEGGQWILRVCIDREGGVMMEHCEAMSCALDEALDSIDPIEEHYLLEVSSPGVERALKKAADYERFTGREVKVRLFSSLNGQKNFTGILRGLAGQDILLETEKQTLLPIPLSQVAKANLTFIDKQKGGI